MHDINFAPITYKNFNLISFFTMASHTYTQQIHKNEYLTKIPKYYINFVFFLNRCESDLGNAHHVKLKSTLLLYPHA